MIATMIRPNIINKNRNMYDMEKINIVLPEELKTKFKPKLVQNEDTGTWDLCLEAEPKKPFSSWILDVSLKTETAAIFGVTADPFTEAHLEIVKKASERFDKVIIVPSTVSYYRQNHSLFNFNQRVAIIREMIQPLIDEGANIEINTIEKNQNENWRAIDTIISIKQKEPEYYYKYIMGQDSYEQFHLWYEYERILQEVDLLVVPRGNCPVIGNPDIPFEIFDIDKRFKNISATKIRERLISSMASKYINNYLIFNQE